MPLVDSSGTYVPVPSYDQDGEPNSKDSYYMCAVADAGVSDSDMAALWAPYTGRHAAAAGGELLSHVEDLTTPSIVLGKYALRGYKLEFPSSGIGANMDMDSVMFQTCMAMIQNPELCPEDAGCTCVQQLPELPLNSDQNAVRRSLKTYLVTSGAYVAGEEPSDFLPAPLSTQVSELAHEMPTDMLPPLWDLSAGSWHALKLIRPGAEEHHHEVQIAVTQGTHPSLVDRFGL